MRVHVISDVHGRAGALRTAGAGADALFCLGDLLLFVDYADEAQGIFAELFGADAARESAARRPARLWGGAGAGGAGRGGPPGADPGGPARAPPARQYA